MVDSMMKWQTANIMVKLKEMAEGSYLHNEADQACEGKLEGYSGMGREGADGWEQADTKTDKWRNDKWNFGKTELSVKF